MRLTFSMCKYMSCSLTHFYPRTVKDGRGFVTQRKDASPGQVEVERGLFGGEREISSSQFATVRNTHTHTCMHTYTHTHTHTHTHTPLLTHEYVHMLV